MISYFYEGDINHKSYKNLYIKLKECIGMFDREDRNAKIQGIYFIYNKNNELMYIGQSKNIASRITTHIRGKYRNSHKIIIESIEDDSLDDIERFLIDKLKPIDNIIVEQNYDLSESWWANFVLDIDHTGKDYNDISKINDHINNGVKTIVYPSYKFVTSIDLLPDLLYMVNMLDKIDNAIIDNVISHARGK